MTSMRKLEIGTNDYTEVYAADTEDDVKVGTASADYTISPINSTEVFATINFQKGPVKEAGVNGCHNEDLIAIVIDRLQDFQEGDFKCRENAIAITKLEEALMWLRKRTEDRKRRNVEGTSNI